MGELKGQNWSAEVLGERATSSLSSLGPSLVRHPRVIERFSGGWSLSERGLNRGLWGKRGEKKGRLRSRWFYLAKKYLSNVMDGGRDWRVLRRSLKPLGEFFLNWREDYKNRFVRLDKEGKSIFIRCVSRFDEKYRGKVRRKLKPLGNIPWDLKIEVTLDPKRFHWLVGEFGFISKGWHKLHNYLKKYFGENFLYFYVLEFQRGGRPHLHILLSFEKVKNYEFVEKMRVDKEVFNDFYENLKRVWMSYGGGWVWVKPITCRNKLNMVSYVLKYVNKTINYDVSENRDFSGLLFASNKRLFNMSRRLQKICGVSLRNTESMGYEYKGTVSEGDLLELVDSVYELGDYVVFVGLTPWAFIRFDGFVNYRELWLDGG